MPKRQLKLQAELVINRQRCEALVERQRVFHNDDDMPHAPSTDPMSNPQSRRTAIHICEFQSIDDQINASYQSASQVETMSRQLEDRIAKIPELTAICLPADGQLVDMAKSVKPDTYQPYCTRLCRAAYFCGIDPGIKASGRREGSSPRAESLRMQTEQLAARNQAAAQQRQIRQNLARGNAATRHEDQQDAPRCNWLRCVDHDYQRLWIRCFVTAMKLKPLTHRN